MNPYCLQFTLITDLITGQQEDKASILTQFQQARVRLLGTSLLQSYRGEPINMEAHQLTLSGVEGHGGSNLVVARVETCSRLKIGLIIVIAQSNFRNLDLYPDYCFLFLYNAGFSFRGDCLLFE